MEDTSNQSEVVDLAATDHTFAERINSLYVGGAGDIACRLKGDTTDRLFKGFAAGSVLRAEVAIVRKVGTSATFLVGLCARTR